MIISKCLIQYNMHFPTPYFGGISFRNKIWGQNSLTGKKNLVQLALSQSIYMNWGMTLDFLKLLSSNNINTQLPLLLSLLIFSHWQLLTNYLLLLCCCCCCFYRNKVDSYVEMLNSMLVSLTHFKETMVDQLIG